MNKYKTQIFNDLFIMSTGFIIPLVSCSAIEALLLAFFHASLLEVIWVVLVSSAFLLLINVILNSKDVDI